MKNSKSFWILILVFVLLIGGASVLYSQLGSRMDMPQLATQGNQSPQETAAATETADTEPTGDPRTPAPDFTVYDLEENPVKLSDYLGKPVVLNFWSSRCGPCKMEMPDFQKIYDEFGEQIHFFMINVTDGSWDTVDSASAFIAESGYTFPVFYDTDISAAYAYAVSSLPTTYFLDDQGYLVAYGIGAMSYDTILQGISMITES